MINKIKKNSKDVEADYSLKELRKLGFTRKKKGETRIKSADKIDSSR